MLSGWRIKRMRMKKSDIPTFLSPPTEVLSNLAKMDMISYQRQKKTKHPFQKSSLPP